MPPGVAPETRREVTVPEPGFFQSSGSTDQSVTIDSGCSGRVRALPSAGAVTGIDGRLRTVERFDRRDEVAGRQAATAEFADRFGSELRPAPLAVGIGVEPDAFLGAGQDLLSNRLIPADWVEVMGDVARVIDEFGLPLVLRVGRLAIGEELGACAELALHKSFAKRFTHTHDLQDWGRFMHNSHCEPFV